MPAEQARCLNCQTCCSALQCKVVYPANLQGKIFHFGCSDWSLSSLPAWSLELILISLQTQLQMQHHWLLCSTRRSKGVHQLC